MNAIYDLSTMPTTFDFSSWLVIAKTNGCSHVSFITGDGIDTRKYDNVTAWKRFGNILAPLCRMAGMTFSVMETGHGEEFPYFWGDVERCYKKHGGVRLIEPTYTAKEKPFVTITMRNSFRNIHRNSDAKEWDKFKGYLERRGKKVIVFEEAEKTPISLEYRMAMYAVSEMNFGVNNGPMSMCAMSEAPYMIFNIIPKVRPVQPTYDLALIMAQMGFGEGSQFSFRTDRQELVWGPDDYENMVNHYEMMFDEKRAAA